MRHVGKRIGKNALKAIMEDGARYYWNKTQEQIKNKQNMIHNSLITNNNSPLTQYPQQNYTCDNCQQEFQQSPLYSVAKNKQELNNSPTYCASCAEPTLLTPIKVRNSKKVKPKKNTVAYYQCMSACCQQGISPKKITQIAQECKHNSLGILAERTQEIQKLNQAYQQIGISLTSLLQPIQE